MRGFTAFTSSYDTFSRCFTWARMFSTMMSAVSTSRMNAAWPSGDFRFSVIARLLRCRFWKSKPCRLPATSSPSVAGGSILMTSAPQSARCRTQVGPARARVRSSTFRPFSGMRVWAWVSMDLSAGLSGILVSPRSWPDTPPQSPIAQERRVSPPTNAERPRPPLRGGGAARRYSRMPARRGRPSPSPHRDRPRQAGSCRRTSTWQGPVAHQRSGTPPSHRRTW